MLVAYRRFVELTRNCWSSSVCRRFLGLPSLQALHVLLFIHRYISTYFKDLDFVFGCCVGLVRQIYQHLSESRFVLARKCSLENLVHRLKIKNISLMH